MDAATRERALILAGVGVEVRAPRPVRQCDEELEARHRALVLSGIPVRPVPDDEDVRALLAALEMFEERRKFNPADHPRNPKGTPGGGRFRSTLDRVVDALKEWADGDGKGDPFEGFDREQLRRVAKERGITLKRGASRDDIAAALKADLKPDAKPDKPKPKAAKPEPDAPKKAAPSKPKKTPKDGDYAAALDAIMKVDVSSKPAPADREQAARDRQADIDSARKVAGVAAELDQILDDGASDKAVLSRLRAAAERDADREIVVENRIRAAYAAVLARRGLTATPGDTQWVGLADLRDELGESTNRHEVDAALFRLAVKDRGTNIVPESNQKMLRPVDREAAISIGNQPRHAIAIDDPSPRPTGGLDLDPVISAVESGDRDKARTEMAKLLKSNGITPYGKAGDSAVFNRAEHQALPGSKLAPGAKVRIVRPGHTLSRDGEDIPLSKSLVEQADEAAPKSDALTAKVGAPRKGRAAVSAVPYRFSGSETANADLFPDLAERVAVNDAFRSYKGIGSRRVNKSLREGTHVDGRVEQMDKAFARSQLSSDVIVWRGGRGFEFGDRATWPADLTGREWTDKAFVSTSPDQIKAEPFARDGVLMRVLAPAGTPAVHLRAPNRIETPESEILLNRGLTFRVVGDGGVVDGVRRLDVEVVGAPANAPNTPAEQVTADPLADLSNLDAESARDALDLKKVPELKQILRDRGLKLSGRKRDLVDRLVEHLNGAPKAVRSRALAMADVPTDDILDAELRALDGNQLKHYWTKGKGLARWRAHPHPWTKLRNLLLKHVGPGRAERMASDWFHEVFGYWPGHRKGSNPVGPG